SDPTARLPVPSQSIRGHRRGASWRATGESAFDVGRHTALHAPARNRSGQDATAPLAQIAPDNRRRRGDARPKRMADARIAMGAAAAALAILLLVAASPAPALAQQMQMPGTMQPPGAASGSSSGSSPGSTMNGQ